MLKGYSTAPPPPPLTASEGGIIAVEDIIDNKVYPYQLDNDMLTRINDLREQLKKNDKAKFLNPVEIRVIRWKIKILKEALRDLRNSGGVFSDF